MMKIQAVLSATLFVSLAACGATGDDSDEASGSANAQTALSGGNLVTNPSFESGVAGWYSWNGSATSVTLSGAPNGARVAKVTRRAGSQFSIGTAKPIVVSAKSSTTYSAIAYVRAASAGSRGKPATLILRERTPAGVQVRTSSSAAVSLSDTFQELKVTATPPTNGNVLDLYVLQDRAASGDAFYIDQVSSIAATATTPSPPPTTTPPTTPTTTPPTTPTTPLPTTPTTPPPSTPPPSTPPPSSGAMPVGVSGNWTMVFDDEFDGTSLDTTKWAANWFQEGGKMNNVGTYAANVAVSGGNLILTLASANSGAAVNTQSNNGFSVKVGMYAEARVYFSGNGSKLYNWPAWWISGPSWPSAGEHDIAEVLSGSLTVNYHSPSGAHNQGSVAGYWGDAFHVYGVHRKASSADVYWDGKLVKSYATDDNGKGESLIFNVGSGGVSSYGASSQMKVDYVRVWQ